MTRRRKPAPVRTRKSLASSGAFESFVLDQLSDLGDVTSRKMFGGVGLNCDGYFFGIIALDELYLKVDERTRGAFETSGAHPFQPYADRPATFQYYSVPVEVLESAPELVKWARKAVGVARAAAAK
jgi:DNA transformation protein